MDITPHQAVKRMKELTELGIPFSFTFMSLDTTRGTSKGFKTINKALLRKSMRADQSTKSHELISYTNHDDQQTDRFFHLSLLMKFNEYTIKP
jgi:hypothetical protein